jgi:hypothetical protein
MARLFKSSGAAGIPAEKSVRIFVLKESVMNGSVTLQTHVTGVAANNFSAAVFKVKNCPAFSKATVILESKSEFSYSVPGEFPVAGHLYSDPLRIL